MDEDEDEFPLKTPQEQLTWAHSVAQFALSKGNVQGALVHLLGMHYYDSSKPGTERADDPGWHPCRCGTWEGYWSSFNKHVAADQVRLLIAAGLVDPKYTPRPEDEE